MSEFRRWTPRRAVYAVVVAVSAGVFFVRSFRDTRRRRGIAQLHREVAAALARGDVLEWKYPPRTEGE